jgi:hypothetical protein
MKTSRSKSIKRSMVGKDMKRRSRRYWRRRDAFKKAKRYMKYLRVPRRQLKTFVDMFMRETRKYGTFK